MNCWKVVCLYSRNWTALKLKIFESVVFFFIELIQLFCMVLLHVDTYNLVNKYCIYNLFVN